MNRLEPDHYRRLLDAEIDRIGAVDPDWLINELPHIEGWTVHSVIGHIGWVARYVGRCLQAPADEPPPRSSVGEPPVGAEVLTWFEEGTAELRAALATADLETLRPTFTGPQPAAWWLRRATQELAMHRWDVQAATGSTDPIDPQLAIDGVDEIFEVFAPNRMQFDVLGGAGETIHLHATDVEGGEWMLELLADEVRWEHGHAKGDVAAKGTASDLLLLMWSRLPPGRLEIFGESGLLDRWQKAAAF